MQQLTLDMAMSQALALTGDLKLGWYTSIPPREMFACQILGTVLGCFANCTLPFPLVFGTQGWSTDTQISRLLASLARSGTSSTARLWILQDSGLADHLGSSTLPVLFGALSLPGDSFRMAMKCYTWGKPSIPFRVCIDANDRFVLGAAVPIACYWAHKRWPGKKFHKVCLDIEITDGG